MPGKFVSKLFSLILAVMRKLILLVIILSVCSVSKAQKLSLEQLDQMLNSSLDEAEESLFLIGYTFDSKEMIADTAGVVYNFSNKKRTIGTAKLVSKGIFNSQTSKSFVRYTTYDRGEFQKFRNQMVEYQFIRSNTDDISENSNYSKANLKVNFEVTTDEYENKTFLITLQNHKAVVAEKLPKKLSLKNIFKQ